MERKAEKALGQGMGARLGSGLGRSTFSGYYRAHGVTRGGRGGEGAVLGWVVSADANCPEGVTSPAD